MKVSSYLWLAIPCVIAASCTNKSTSSSADAPARTVFFDKSGMDTTVKPGDNFFLYTSGAWMKKTEIPASETGWGSFYTLYDENQKNLRKILEGLTTADSPAGSKEQKVGDFYASGMDTVAIEKSGYEPVKPLLAKIDAVKDYKQLISLSAEGYKDGDGFLLGFYVSPDDRISTKYAVNFTQAGLGLPNRDYYFKTDSASQNIRKQYVNYIAKLFTLTGTDAATAAKQADDILKLETAIAGSHLTPVELRDPVKNYNKFTVSDFQKQIPDIDLKAILGKLDVKVDTILVGQPKYFKALDGLLKSQPIDVWKNKLKFTALSDASNALSKSFRDANFEFFGKTLSGQKKQKERWKKMATNVDGSLGELLGQLYVEKYFTADAKKRMLDLVNNLQTVYHSRIEKLDWMSADTKKRAIAKLDAFTKKIGYPDKWKKYDDVEINKGTYYKNLQSIAKHDFKEMVGKLGKPVDKTEWGMTPPTVNAYYNPAFNEIVFPAGILQFPFFDKDADDAINYGAIGAVIGHEMTHGFDDQGRQYDKDGNLKDWWTPEDAAKFKTKVQVVIDQYNKYTVLNDLHVNGSLTQGENLADIGGLAIAYQAFKNTEQGKSDKKIDGFTPDQRFFLAFGQVWRIKNRDERLRMRISVDPHSPEMYRVNGPLSNMPEFYKAFNVKPGDKLYRPENERVKVW
ncbi:M13 family metallopeptidase [Mucilaginibacter paludis]|uniref:Peptidase M13 n=1 Tax=Mucilaginibacter paludis DSM 18603 TaxID=714943 RepID=H1Y074_9SPHI|nr:M13 family metallopeptidase [Mucilaginibacter paludis]EHQ27983.1 peptidase M13 [Mucilaginibacter paludis DSM 18603]